MHVLFDPALEVLGDGSAVLFRHHDVAIAGQPFIFEVHERGLYSCLIEPLGYAMGVRTVITRFSGHVEDWDSHEVNELVCRLLLNPARNEVRSIRLILSDGLQLGGFVDRGIITNRKIGQTP